MSLKLRQLVYLRASNSKDPDEYIEIVERLYRLYNLPDDEFIKEMGW